MSSLKKPTSPSPWFGQTTFRLQVRHGGQRLPAPKVFVHKTLLRLLTRRFVPWAYCEGPGDWDAHAPCIAVLFAWVHARGGAPDVGVLSMDGGNDWGVSTGVDWRIWHGMVYGGGNDWCIDWRMDWRRLAYLARYGAMAYMVLGTVWHGLAQLDTVWRGMARYGVHGTWHGLAQLDTVWRTLAHGMAYSTWVMAYGT